MHNQVRTVQVLKAPNGKSPFWYLRWWELKPDGKGWKEKWRSTKTTVKKKAEQQRRSLERELEGGRRAEGEMTWDDFVVEFTNKWAASKRPATVDLYRYCLDAFTKFGMPKRIEDIDAGVLEDFVAWRLGNGQAKATANRDLRHLRAALKWAKRRGHISEVPEFQGAFVREDRRQPVVIPEEDFLAFVRALKDPKLELTKRSADWWLVFLYMAYYLGLRRGEILGLTWEQVNFQIPEIHVLAGTSKARKERPVPLPVELVELLKQWQGKESVITPTDCVLPWPYETYRELYVDWHAIQKAAGIADGKHYVPKNCRSTCASSLIAANVPTVVVKDLLGHASVTTTENYYINTKPALRAAIAARKVQLIPDVGGSDSSLDSQTESRFTP